MKSRSAKVPFPSNALNAMSAPQARPSTDQADIHSEQPAGLALLREMSIMLIRLRKFVGLGPWLRHGLLLHPVLCGQDEKC